MEEIPLDWTIVKFQMPMEPEHALQTASEIATHHQNLQTK